MPKLTRALRIAAGIQSMRLKMNLNQQEFADRYGLSVKTLRNWEQGVRAPEQAAMLLLHLIKVRPEIVATEVKKLKEKKA